MSSMHLTLSGLCTTQTHILAIPCIFVDESKLQRPLLVYSKITLLCGSRQPIFSCECTQEVCKGWRHAVKSMKSVTASCLSAHPLCLPSTLLLPRRPWQSAPVAFYRPRCSVSVSASPAIHGSHIYLPICRMVRVIDNQSFSVTVGGLTAGTCMPKT